MSHRVAVVQHPPVMLNRTETLERGVRLVGHYSRADVFKLEVHADAREPVTFTNRPVLT
jgi:hypothetical protein